MTSLGQWGQWSSIAFLLLFLLPFTFFLFFIPLFFQHFPLHVNCYLAIILGICNIICNSFIILRQTNPAQSPSQHCNLVLKFPLVLAYLITAHLSQVIWVKHILFKTIYAKSLFIPFVAEWCFLWLFIPDSFPLIWMDRYQLNIFGSITALCL